MAAPITTDKMEPSISRPKRLSLAASAGAYSAAHRSVLRVISTAAEEGETVEIITCASERPEGRSPQGYSRVLTGAHSLPNARPSGRQQGGASGTMKGRAAAARVVCVRGAWSWREKRGRPASGALCCAGGGVQCANFRRTIP